MLVPFKPADLLITSAGLDDKLRLGKKAPQPPAAAEKPKEEKKEEKKGEKKEEKK